MAKKEDKEGSISRAVVGGQWEGGEGEEGDEGGREGGKEQWEPELH